MQTRTIVKLANAGFSDDEIKALGRIERTLQRWAELEAGNGDQYKSWGIERDDETGKAYMGTHPHNGPSYRVPIADRETGALKRLAALMKGHAGYVAEHQGDPRGCVLRIVPVGGDSYRDGIAVT